MTTFFDANQVRLILKMKLFQYNWYNDCSVVTSPDNLDYIVLVGVTKIDDAIRKIVGSKVKGVDIKLKID